MEPHENVVGDLAMVIGVGVRVHVVREAHRGEAFRPDLVVSPCDDLRFDALVRCLERGRRSVHVAAGDHDGVVACQPVVAHENVGRDVHAGDVAEVRGPVYVGPCDRDKYLSGQVAPLLGQLGGTGGNSEV